MSGFDVNRSRIGEDRLAEFLAAPLPTSLIDVPGVGDVTVKRLAKYDIYNPMQLVGCFLRICGEGMTSDDRCNAFWYYLKVVGVPGGTRSTIVHAIAEKVNIMIPGVYGIAADVDTTMGSPMEVLYCDIMMGVLGDNTVPSDIQVYDSESFKLIKHLTRDGVLEKFVIGDNGLMYTTDEPMSLVLSDTILHDYCRRVGCPPPENIKIIKIS